MEIERKITICEPVTGPTIFENLTVNLETDILKGGLTFRNCTINHIGRRIRGCTFEHCKILACAGVEDCTFSDVEALSVYDGYIRNCKFTNPQSVMVYDGGITGCRFSDVRCDCESVIYLENSEIYDCSFNNVCLSNGSYLLEGMDDMSVQHCCFSNCSTDRDDLKIIYRETTTGRLFKKRTPCPVSTDTCKGLDRVILLG